MQFLEDLNPEQQAAAKTLEGPVMVIAGPGSGKTRVLTYRIAHLIKIGVPAFQILALTFTNKAAKEMKERVVKLVGEKSTHIWMGTFHSIFARLLRVECDKVGFEKTFSIYDTQDMLGVMKNIMTALKIPTQQYNPQAIRTRISAAKNELVSSKEYSERASDIFEEKTAAVYAEYSTRMKRNNAMDFDDLLTKPIELFQNHKKVLEKYQDRFRFILIDEYQDTNHAQYILIKELAAKYRNICVVGDDAQSIYSFRGADIRNILDFEHDYPDARTIRLEQNYRSTKNILAAADQLIKHNLHQIPKNLRTTNQAGNTITLLACADDRDEGASIVSRIFEESHARKLDLKDVAIMYRTNAQSRSIEDALRRNSIPYTIVGGIEFYQRKEVKDVLAYFRVLVNPKDNESFLRIVNFPTRGIGDVALKRLEQYAHSHGISYLEAAQQAELIGEINAKAVKSLLKLHAFFLKYVQVQLSMSFSELARSFVDEIGILSLLKEEVTQEGRDRWENVQELLSSISEFSAGKPDATLEDFLQDVSLVSDLDRWEDTRNAVTLMTLHSAKGLEFPVVFITGMEEGLLPYYNTAHDRENIEEERRLCYVGISRAMTKLYLSHARVRYRYSEMIYQSPSRFLSEIDSSLLETVGEGRSEFFEEKKSLSHVSGKHARKSSTRNPSMEPCVSDTMPDYEHQYDEDFTDTPQVGRSVEHNEFGRGTIIQVAGSGDALKVVVDFHKVGRKHLMLKYARLKFI